MIAYDPETGQFNRIGRTQGARPGESAGTKKPCGRLEISIFGRRHYAHRLAWVIAHGNWPAGVVDHINGDPSDNRLCNLRDVSQQINTQNRRRAQKPGGASGLLGVTFNKQRSKWAARIAMPAGNSKHLGYHDTAELAHEAYLAAKRQFHDGCTI
jgi:hypothetical protein